MNSIPKPKSTVKYRPDIDGLRALAVLSVVFYHLGLPLHGGYIGVDIFFTISGFLIGSIILRETAGHTFRFTDFYQRRIRRIVPALVVVLIASTWLACIYLLPAELVGFAKSLLATSLSVSNFYFWLQSGYFAGPAHDQPLLHTWSLAVEEQFYMFLPPFLFMMRRLAPKRIGPALYVCALASLVLSAFGVYRDSTASFYLPHTRAWELLLGTIVGLEHYPKVSSRLLRDLLAALGLALIVAPLVLYNDLTPFPGLAALPPCLGTALIIAIGLSGETYVGRCLSLRPVVFVGLISYSLYLWHWPLITFYRFGATWIDGLSRHESQALLFTLSVMLATASWKFIELPFRAGALRGSGPLLWSGAAGITAILAGCSLMLILLRGIPSRFPTAAREVALYLDEDPHDTRDQYRNGTCFVTSQSATLKDFPIDTCLPDKPGRKNVLVLGDSHAAALWWGFSQLLPDANVMQATASGCKPVLNQRPGQYASCTGLMHFVLTDYLLHHKVDALLIEAHWDEGDLQSVGDTVEWLRKRDIPLYLFGPIVQYDSALPRLLAMSISRNDPLLPERHLEKFVAPLDRHMATLAHDTWRVPYISLLDLFCVQGSCLQYSAPGVPLLSDYGHLTKLGSVLAARKVSALSLLPMGAE
jgi:peptidoglycan/LPS O-acetylase OafA/YrhL